MTRLALAIPVALIAALCATGPVEPASAETVVSTSPGTRPSDAKPDGTPAQPAAPGAISVIADDTANKLEIFEGIPRRFAAIPLASFLAATPQYRQMLGLLEESLEVRRRPLLALSKLLLKLALPITALIMVNPSTTEDDIEQGPWLIVKEHVRHNRISAIPPCRTVRELETETLKNAVGCPVLRHAQVDLPTNLFVDTRAGNDELAIALRDERYGGAIWSRTALAGPGDDYVIGSRGADVIAGEAGEDKILGMAGSDEIWGDELRSMDHTPLGFGENDDSLFGGMDGDMVFGQWDDDLVMGDDGDDAGHPYTVFDDPALQKDISGAAALQGGPGSDVVIGGPGSDTMQGNEDADTLLARESDFNQPEEPDPLVDCGGNMIWNDSDRKLPEFYRASASADVVTGACDQRVPLPVEWDDVLEWNWELRAVFPWEYWD